MWSLKKINLTAARRRIRQSLLQQDIRSVNVPQAKHFNALSHSKIAQSPKQVIIIIRTRIAQILNWFSFHLQIKGARNEFFAIIKLLERSSLNSSQITRHLSTSIRLFEQESDKNKSNEPNQAKKNQNDSDAHKKSDGKRPDKKKRKKLKPKMPEDFNRWNRLIAMLTNSVLWIALIYGVGFAIFIVMSTISGRTEHQNSERYIVSWKEFVQYMLAAGEVKELVVRPQYDYVKIVLHDGAIINGRRAWFQMYLLQVPNVDHFEQRLRELEKRMGISESMLYVINVFIGWRRVLLLL